MKGAELLPGPDGPATLGVAAPVSDAGITPGTWRSRCGTTAPVQITGITRAGRLALLGRRPPPAALKRHKQPARPFDRLRARRTITAGRARTRSLSGAGPGQRATSPDAKRATRPAPGGFM